MAAGKPTRSVLLVEDTTALRTLLASALETAGFDVTACASANDAIKAFPKADPDVLIADIDLGDRPNGVELATILRAQAPYLAIVFVTNYPSTKAFARTVAPPPGYALLQKDLLKSTDQLIEVVESALNDAVDPKVMMRDGPDHPLGKLTTPQLEIVRLVAAGLTNAEIAERRGSSLRAAERLVTRAFEVLGVNDDPQHNPRVVVANLYTKSFGYPVLEELR
jgi:DNA-binding NarL/FixJ family response regulator